MPTRERVGEDRSAHACADMRRVRHARVRAGEIKTQRPALRVVVFLSTHKGIIRTAIIHNEHVKYGLLFGWGIGIYAVMFLLWSAFITYGFVEGAAPRIAGLVALLIVAIAAGRSLHAHSWKDILPYSIVWGIMMALFDLILSTPLTGWQLYSDWNVWVGYLLVALFPLFSLYPRFERFYGGPPESI
jgi:hypothetical protein